MTPEYREAVYLARHTLGIRLVAVVTAFVVSALHAARYFLAYRATVHVQVVNHATDLVGRP